MPTSRAGRDERHTRPGGAEINGRLRSQSVRYGIRNDRFVVGLEQVGSAGRIAGSDQFETGTGSITYPGTTTVWDSVIGTTKSVNIRLVLSVGSVTGGTMTATVTNGTPPKNPNGGSFCFRAA